MLYTVNVMKETGEKKDITIGFKATKREKAEMEEVFGRTCEFLNGMEIQCVDAALQRHPFTSC